LIYSLKLLLNSSQILIELQALVNQLYLLENERGMIFFRTKVAIDEFILKNTTIATWYYGEDAILANDRICKSNMQDWKRGVYKWIACTCGASLGIDYPSVRY
jgi:hypothetical protein